MNEPVPAPTDPMAVARVILDDYQVEGCLTLRQWRGSWMRWQQSRWVEIEDAELRSSIYQRLEGATFIDYSKKTPEVKEWQPTRHKVDNVLDASGAVTHLATDVDPPAWLNRDEPRSADCVYRGTEIVACTNGLLHVGTRELLDLTPTFFNTVAVPFDYDPDAAEPKRWLTFLAELWPDDPDSTAALQEIFGYVLSGRTDLHKILLLVGPTRSGKGTIARVLTALVGRGNAAGPTLASLGTNFGLSPLLGKPLAVVSDARLGKENVNTVVERLLSVSGEDMLTVDRKYREPWTGKLPTRFVLLSNELPRFGDASGAIAARFIVLMLEKSFLGKENTRLTDELLTELPGILRWSLDGLDRVASRSFTTPASSADAVTALQDLVSPVAAFVRDNCRQGAGLWAEVDELYAAWKAWCDDNGHKKTSVQTFGRDLRAVLPQVRVKRPHGGKRHYLGVSPTNNGESRGSTRFSGSDEPVNRVEPRRNPLWVHTEDDPPEREEQALEVLTDQLGATVQVTEEAS